MAVFPNPQTVALSAAIASGVFAEPDDRELFTAIVRLNAQLNELADHLALTEMMALKGDALTFRTRLRDGPVLHNTTERLAAFGKLLRGSGVVDEPPQS